MRFQLLLIALCLVAGCSAPGDVELVDRFRSERRSFDRLLELALAQPGNEVSLVGLNEKERREVGELAHRTHVGHVYGDKKHVLFSVTDMFTDGSCTVKGYMFVPQGGEAPPDSVISPSLDKDDLRPYEWKYSVIGDGWYLFRASSCD